MKIAIKFGDNDFYNTFIPLLEVLNRAYQWNDKLPEDKNKLCFIINQLSINMYLLFQNQYEYNGMENVVDGLKTDENDEWIHIKDYFKITPENILLNDEVDKYLSETKWDNSDTYLLDTEVYKDGVKTGYVWTI